MKRARLIKRLASAPGPVDYTCAAGLAAASSVSRFALQFTLPGTIYLGLLLPVVALSGIVWGTRPAMLAASICLAGQMLPLSALPHAWAPLDVRAADGVVFLLGCAIVLYATAALRRVAAEAASANARLSEVFRQIPASAAIIEAPNGHLLMRSAHSDQVVGRPVPHLRDTAEMQLYGGLHADGTRFAAEDYPIVRALKAGEVVQGERFLYRTDSGDVVDLEVHAGPVRDPAGRIVAAVGMAFDVSARARFERELLASEARCRATAEHLRAAIDAGALGLWEFEAATQIFTLDARMAAMLGLPADETRLTRPDLRAFIDPADRAHAASAFDEAGKTAGLYADEVRIRTVQGETRWLISRGAALPERGRIVGVVSDITGRHQREESLEAALRANDVLMREADHRIKNSLQLVAAVLHLQMNRLRDADARGALAEAIGRVDAVANAHLALQNSPDLKTIDVGRMLLNMCERMGKLNPSVAVRCEPEPDIALDAERAIPLGMIASELLTNALRHAYPPGVQGEVQVTASAEHEVLAITITDGGAGMSPSSVKPGLGSTVVATLARKLGAEIATDAPSGGGTSVTLRLRLADLGAGI